MSRVEMEVTGVLSNAATPGIGHCRKIQNLHVGIMAGRKVKVVAHGTLDSILGREGETKKAPRDQGNTGEI